MAEGTPAAKPVSEAVVDLSRLPRLRSPHAPAEVVERLATASRRGRLPGFRAGEGTGDFRLRLFGGHFDRVITGAARAEGAGSVVELRARLIPWLPTVFVVVSIATVWPGVILMDSLLASYFESQAEWWPTWWWYVPLAAIPLPFAARSLWRSSKKAAIEEATKIVGKLEKELDAARV